MVFKTLKSLAKMLKYDTTPILENTEHLIEFIDKQSAFVSQVTLYTYIKTRAGTQWPKLFENETYLTSLKIARWHIFAACVADLSIFAAAQPYKAGLMDKKQSAYFAQFVINHILSAVEQEDIDPNLFLKKIEASRKRCQKMDYARAAEGDFAFDTSAQALIDWAPVSDEFKKNDEAIVRNSIHLRWISIRRDVARGLNMERLMADWNQQNAAR